MSLVSHQAKAADETHCLATALYNEARGEQLHSQLAVAGAVLNRTQDDAFPSTICGVVYQRGQFQNINRWRGLSENNSTYAKMLEISKNAIQRFNNGDTLGFQRATYFTTGRFKSPQLCYLGKIGGHNYYGRRNVSD